jgi:hypothetical protein
VSSCQLRVRQRGRAQARAGVAGGRLHKQALERPLARDAPVGHAVERDAAGQAQVGAVDLRRIAHFVE